MCLACCSLSSCTYVFVTLFSSNGMCSAPAAHSWKEKKYSYLHIFRWTPFGSSHIIISMILWEMCGLSDLGQGHSVCFSSIFGKLCRKKGHGPSPVSRCLPSSSGGSFLLCMLTHFTVVQMCGLSDLGEGHLIQVPLYTVSFIGTRVKICAVIWWYIITCCFAVPS